MDGAAPVEQDKLVRGALLGSFHRAAHNEACLSLRASTVALRLAAACLAATGLASTEARAQTVLLQIKPQVGDTIFMILDQRSEITGTRHTASGASTSSMGNTMRMWSRAIIEGTTVRGTTVLAVTDSVEFTSTDQGAAAFTAELQRTLRGQRTRFVVAPDGSVGMADRGTTTASRELADMVAVMPAALPRAPVRVGDVWEREMPVPGGGPFGSSMAGVLRARFRFDSLSRSGTLAYISMRGEMEVREEGGAPALVPGAERAVLERGSVAGSMLVDRMRGWVTESRFTITVHSKLTPAASTGVYEMVFQTRIVQRMRTLRGQ